MTPRPQKPKLGRGLAALLGEAAEDASMPAQSVRTIPVTQLRPGPYQPRLTMDADSLQSLADSIRASGILQPILVRPEPDEPDQWQIVAGERRWRAAQLAGLHDVPCLVRGFTDSDALAAGLVENLQRRDLDAIEEAEGYRRLAQEFELTQEDVAALVGKSRAHVANTLRLLGLPPVVQAEVRNGALTAGHARALVTHPNPEQAALQILARGLNVRQAEALAKPAPPRPRADKDRDTVALEEQLSRHLGLSVTIRHGRRGGEVRIAYADLDQLDGVVRVLGRK
jgi:ParB family chromosome partitioning protein